jgi:hypothetical protein
MMIWLRKVGFFRDVAAKAKGRLRMNQQVFRFCRMVGRMTVQTAHIVTRVHGTGEMALLVILTVASQAASVRVLLGKVLKADDLCDISAACNVLWTGAVARLASVPVRERGFEMGRVLEIFLE